MEALNLSQSKSHLGRQIIPSCQMFEAEEAVPLAGATSAGVIVHNLRQRHKMERRVQLSSPRLRLTFYLLSAINMFDGFRYLK